MSMLGSLLHFRCVWISGKSWQTDHAYWIPFPPYTPPEKRWQNLKAIIRRTKKEEARVISTCVGKWGPRFYRPLAFSPNCPLGNSTVGSTEILSAEPVCREASGIKGEVEQGARDKGMGWKSRDRAFGSQVPAPTRKPQTPGTLVLPQPCFPAPSTLEISLWGNQTLEAQNSGTPSVL